MTAPARRPETALTAPGDSWSNRLVTRPDTPIPPTGRLHLRRFTPADLDDLAALHGDPEVMRYIDATPAPRAAVAERTLPEIFTEYERLPEGLGRFAVLEKETHAFVGWVSLAPANSVGLEEHQGLELGYRLRPAMRGRGYAPEAARALIRTVFERYNGHGRDRVVATTMTVNAASRRVMEKVGLHYVRTFFAEWPDYLEGAEHGDVVYERTWADLRRL
jgi:RimJ/RimL family protein N-acetyltransferase